MEPTTEVSQTFRDLFSFKIKLLLLLLTIVVTMTFITVIVYYTPSPKLFQTREYFVWYCRLTEKVAETWSEPPEVRLLDRHERVEDGITNKYRNVHTHIETKG